MKTYRFTVSYGDWSQPLVIEIKATCLEHAMADVVRLNKNLVFDWRYQEDGVFKNLI